MVVFLRTRSNALLSEQNSSEELLHLVERYWDHFRVAPQYPSYMSFISSYANNSFAREHFRKEKDACLAGKIGSYTQVKPLLMILNNNHSVNCSRVLDYFVLRRFSLLHLICFMQVIKRTLASLPYNSQSQSPSAYFDQYLFHYDEKVRVTSACSRCACCMNLSTLS